MSHSGQDTWVARQIAREITQCGAHPFLDEAEIALGADFEDDILKSLESAEELVVLLTPWALDRPYVWAEVGAAWGRRLPIVAILHGISPDELQSKAKIPVLLKKKNLVELNGIEQYFTQLRGRIKPKSNEKKKASKEDTL